MNPIKILCETVKILDNSAHCLHDSCHYAYVHTATIIRECVFTQDDYTMLASMMLPCHFSLSQPYKRWRFLSLRPQFQPG